MAKRGGSCGPTRGPQVKNAGRANLFNLLTRPTLARGPRGPATGRDRLAR